MGVKEIDLAKSTINRGVSIQRLRSAADYLEAYEARKLEQDQKLDN